MWLMCMFVGVSLHSPAPALPAMITMLQEQASAAQPLTHAPAPTEPAGDFGPDATGQQPPDTQPAKRRGKGRRAEEAEAEQGAESEQGAAAAAEQPGGPLHRPTGPMRIEPLAIFDGRVKDWAPQVGRGLEPGLRIQLQITGERLGEVVRSGKMIVEEIRDDTGASLLKSEDVKPRDTWATQQVSVTARVLRQGFLPTEAMFKSPQRRAAKISRLKGYLNVVYGAHVEDVVVRDPLRYEGRNVENERLKELGVVIRVLKIGEEVEEAGEGRGIAIRIDAGDDNVRGVDFFDAWLRRLYTQTRTDRGTDERRYTYFSITRGRLDPDCQMVVTVFPRVEREKLEFDLRDLELP